MRLWGQTRQLDKPNAVRLWGQTRQLDKPTAGVIFVDLPGLTP